MRRFWVPGLLFGLAIFTGLLVWQGIDTLLTSLRTIGWDVFWLPALFMIPLAVAVQSWRTLFTVQHRPSAATATRATWVALSVNWLLPVAQIGGELVRARMLLRRGHSLDQTAATLVVDKTLQVVSQIAFAVIGLALFVGNYSDEAVVVGALCGVSLFAILAVGFYRVQRSGMFGLFSRLAGQLLQTASRSQLEASGVSVDRALHDIYGRRTHVVVAFVWRLCFRVTLAAEVYLILNLLGHPMGWVEVIVLESLGQGIRAAAFAIPGGLGAQEGGFVLIGLALGMGPEVGLSVSLCKRVRELSVGLPGLVAWQLEEARHAVNRNGVRHDIS